MLQENYGFDNPDQVALVKKVFLEVNVPKLYEMYESSVTEEISDLIKTLCPAAKLPESIFLKLMNKLRQRSK